MNIAEVPPPRGRATLLLAMVATMAFGPPPALAQEPAADTARVSAFDAALEGAEPLGEGPAQLYRKGDQTLLALPPTVFDRLILWYAEAARIPTATVSLGGNAIGELAVRLERRGSRVFVRDLTSAASKRAVVGPEPTFPVGPGSEAPTEAPSAPDPSTPSGEEVPAARTQAKLDPIQIAVADASLGPLILAFDVAAERDDGTVLIDVTAAFSGDIGGDLSARSVAQAAGFMPLAVSPGRSYVERARSYPENISIRSHLTFQNATGGSLSVVVGHSLVVLPEEPMPARRFDSRVGFFKTGFVEFGGEGVVSESAFILRHRLDRADPAAEGPGDPVEPLIYYVGRGVPNRWRPYVTRGIESWAPVFEAAGFTNAIVARDAPSLEDDPDWSPEDVRFNVIRWLPQANANAMGPVTYDPRSGEIIGAHILLWPSVLPFFGSYYHVLHATVDPAAATFPLSEEKLGELLAYVVAHEVGHTLGLRHNHLASTAYTVEQLRDPAFADVHGPNASIMAYGRFNQAAQPGDGVTRFLPVMGPYDRHAIRWGYDPLPGRSEAERSEVLDRLATEGAADRLRAWAAGEFPDEQRSKMDPRVQMENVGADRVEATRLGMRRIAGFLEELPERADGDREWVRTAYDQALSRAEGLLSSVATLVGGVYDDQDEFRRYATVVPREEQRRAVAYLLGEGQASLSAFLSPALIRVIEPVGARRSVAAKQEALLLGLLGGGRLATLAEQKAENPGAYGVVELGDDIVTALFGDLEDPDSGTRELQATFLERTAAILDAPRDSKTRAALQALISGLDPDPTEILAASGSDTAYPAWARRTLPELLRRIEAMTASTRDPELRLHYDALAYRIRTILAEAPALPPAG